MDNSVGYMTFQTELSIREFCVLLYKPQNYLYQKIIWLLKNKWNQVKNYDTCSDNNSYFRCHFKDLFESSYSLIIKTTAFLPTYFF